MNRPADPPGPSNYTHGQRASQRRPLVLFDGGCPLCSREIRHYRRLRGADGVDWLDISRDDTPLPVDGIDRATAMARFHVRGRDGRWHQGAFGFAELWSHLRGYRHLSRLLRLTRLLPLVDRLYDHFARWRVRDRCTSDICAGPAATPTRRNQP